MRFALSFFVSENPFNVLQSYNAIKIASIDNLFGLILFSTF